MIGRLATGILALCLAVSCAKPLTVEQQVIATIRDMEASIEAGERRAFLEHFTEDFSGRRGAMNHDQLRAMVVFQLNRYKNLQARLFPIRVTETGAESATAAFRALVTGGPGWIPENGQVFDFVTYWRLEGGSWMLHAADWEPVALEEAL